MGGNTCAVKWLARGSGANRHGSFGGFVGAIVLVDRGVSRDPVEVDDVGGIDDDVSRKSK